MKDSKIEWTDHTANFWWGCQKVSLGCQNCYAETWAHRLGKSIWGPSTLTQREYKRAIWDDIPKWDWQAKVAGHRQRVFVQSMADLFEDHPQVVRWRRDAMKLMGECVNLDFLVLTKRPENIARMMPLEWCVHWPDHVWIGTSVEHQKSADKRIPELLKIPAKVRFLSMEPLLGPVSLDRWFGLMPGHRWAECLCAEIDEADRPCITCEARQALGSESGIDWIIVGGESGPNARPMHPSWVRGIRDQCQNAAVSFFFKQWGEWIVSSHVEQHMPQGTMAWPWAQRLTDGNITGDTTMMLRVGKKNSGRLLDGRQWNEIPWYPGWWQH